MPALHIHFGDDPKTLQALADTVKRLGRIESAIAELRKFMSKVDDAIAAFKASVDASFATVNANLDNIVSDEAALAKQIADLQNQILNDANSTLSPASQALLDQLGNDAANMALRTKQMADSVPDTVTPPTA